VCTSAQGREKDFSRRSAFATHRDVGNNNRVGNTIGVVRDKTLPRHFSVFVSYSVRAEFIEAIFSEGARALRLCSGRTENKRKDGLCRTVLHAGRREQAMPPILLAHAMVSTRLAVFAIG
jgi:hypothetical protein